MGSKKSLSVKTILVRTFVYPLCGLLVMLAILVLVAVQTGWQTSVDGAHTSEHMFIKR